MSRLATLPAYMIGVVREIGLGVDTAHAVLHGVPVPDRARRACAPNSRS